MQVTGIPTDGSQLYVTLWYRVGGVWSSIMATYTAADVQPEITSPLPGSVLPGSSALFQWIANGYPVTEWWLYAGPSAGSNGYYDSGSLGLQTTDTVMGLPTDGSTVYVTLYYPVAGLWQSSVFQYTAAGP